VDINCNFTQPTTAERELADLQKGKTEYVANFRLDIEIELLRQERQSVIGSANTLRV
jgi:hypothetical protein